MDLSNELKLLIVEFLDAEEVNIPERNEHNVEHYSTERLPKANTNMLSLSCVNRLLRSIVAPFLFRTVILRNTKTSGQSLQTLANGPYASLVKRIEYLGVTYFPVTDGGHGLSIYPPNMEDFPVEAEDVLANLHRFKNLETVRLLQDVQPISRHC
jgi:hypothetical protein